MARQKKWIINHHDQKLIEHISDKFNISPVVSAVLLNRGITSDDEIYNFINTDSSQFLNPFELSGMEAAVNEIERHVSNNEKIAVYGDYDVDGITSTYILYDYLKSQGADVIYYIPDRADEGYGVHKAAIDKLHALGIKLIVTVDVGITAVQEVAYAEKLGINFVITDHHTPQENVPEALAVINPKLKICKYQNKNLAGVGVAYKLVYALSGCNVETMNKYCEAACIGTIADMVPITGENRFIVKHGLKLLSETKHAGLNALIEISGIDKASLTSSNVSFGLSPRLNAAGRIASAKLSVELFLENDESNALKIAQRLDEGNKLRQSEEQKILEEAIDIIESRELYNNNVIVVAKENWHHGIIGIVSSKITEKYYKPSTVISIDSDGNAKASGRSISGFNLFDALAACADTLSKFGGHELAAGFSLPQENISDFSTKINEYADAIMTPEILTPKLYIDAELEAKDVTLDLFNQLNIAEPFGIGNKTPVFSINNSEIRNVKTHKSGKHAFLNISNSGYIFDTPAFNMADEVSIYSRGDIINIAGTLNTNSYHGVVTPQFIIRDISPDETTGFTVENLRSVFRCLKSYMSAGYNVINISDITNNLRKMYNCNFGKERIKKALSVFDEINLIKSSVQYNTLTLMPGDCYTGSCDIESSPTYVKTSSR